MTDLSSLEASVRQEAAAGTKGDRIPAAYVAEVFDALRAAEAARDAALAERDEAREQRDGWLYNCEEERNRADLATQERDAALKERDEARAKVWKLENEWVSGQSFGDCVDAALARAEAAERECGVLREQIATRREHGARADERLAAERARGDRMAEALREEHRILSWFIKEITGTLRAAVVEAWAREALVERLTTILERNVADPAMGGSGDGP